MQFSEAWLREFVDPPVSAGELAEQLTMAGLEVEGLTASGPLFAGVVVGRVDKVEAHPRSEKLKVCVVDDGSGSRLTVVCGADNVRAGGSYPLARVGATLPGDVRIQAATIQGVASDGMLCSEAELGLADEAEGIYELGDTAEPGTDLRALLALNDHIIDISLTPNRGDCLSLTGLARETAVVNQLPFRLPGVEPVPAAIRDTREIRLGAAEACPRYCGRIIRDIDAGRPAPLWVTERLRRSGIRSINAVVDLTNYVMLECGQPMHAFDNDILKGGIDVRYARNGEKLTLLDGQIQELSAETLVICDDTGPVAMAGIMGGLPTAVNGRTQVLFLESAFFSPQAVMGRARRYGLHTDASHRFERGVDPELPRKALERLSRLIIEYCGGMAGPVTEAVNEKYLPETRSLVLRAARVRRLLGQDVPAGRIVDILERLGFELGPGEAEWQVRVPSHRFDIALEADLIEEIARIDGYGRVTGTVPGIRMRMKPARETRIFLLELMQTLVSRNYREVITYSFVDPRLQEMLQQGPAPVSLLNPISSDMAVMRQSLWPGLLQALDHNIKRQQQRVRLFETGQVFPSLKLEAEERCVAGLIYGNLHPEQWDVANRLCDFYDLKADVEAILGLRLDPGALSYRRSKHPALHPGQSADIFYQDREIGRMGALHPGLMKKLDIQHPVYLFECLLSMLSSKKRISYAKLSKFPSIRRDISIIVDKKVPVINVINCIKTAAPEGFHNLELFDVYEGEGIDLGKKSLALGLTFQRTSSTLTDEEADAAVSGILDILQRQFGAIMRE